MAVRQSGADEFNTNGLMAEDGSWTVGSRRAQKLLSAVLAGRFGFSRVCGEMEVDGTNGVSFRMLSVSATIDANV